MTFTNHQDARCFLALLVGIKVKVERQLWHESYLWSTRCANHEEYPAVSWPGFHSTVLARCGAGWRCVCIVIHIVSPIPVHPVLLRLPWKGAVSGRDNSWELHPIDLFQVYFISHVSFHFLCLNLLAVRYIWARTHLRFYILLISHFFHLSLLQF